MYSISMSVSKPADHLPGVIQAALRTVDEGEFRRAVSLVFLIDQVQQGGDAGAARSKAQAPRPRVLPK